MGEEIEAQRFTGADRTRHREKIRACLAVLGQMLADGRFDAARPMVGLELELNLVDGDERPSLRGADVLAALDDDAFQTELGRFNLEVNLPPARLDEGALAGFEEQIGRRLAQADAAARTLDARVVSIGVLPTLEADDLDADALSEDARYHLLSEQILDARGEDVRIDVAGEERVRLSTSTIVPEAACTSTQVHLQTSPAQFAATWNAAQAASGVQVALAANAPFLLGRETWHETRIPLFTQATDTRPDELRAQGVRPRVWFGERWITSVFDLFEENLRYFPALLPVVDEEDPAAELAAGRTPSLAELTLHNGTVYRWNRPVYDVVDGLAHLRVESRVLPAGPSAVDVAADAALFLGLVRALAEQERPVWAALPFGAARANLVAAARHGLGATLAWPDERAPGLDPHELDVTTLVRERLLPLVEQGLADAGVSRQERDRYLAVLEGRCASGVNGAVWSLRTVERHEAGGASRREALRRMLAEYRERQADGAPVHTW
ncbi:glutamate--cysteine ligase [Nocardioides sp. TRM66260-LWL]|uniref:glutamate--cysteine ligase n=1 Tax=Nocardioides sp. TRM66260-LWL TaxID=2874478 RepID=UPI001CC3B821|nr:glutamate--cysteine ligase [Nocardioides sp. TRM66260-LWL]MBZ5733712.1 glutamate--cysteine ligase [Nocardioides sp. TRM66260-LWL]